MSVFETCGRSFCGPTHGSFRNTSSAAADLLQCFCVDSTHTVLKVKPLIPQWEQKVGGFDSTASVTTQFGKNLLNLSRACCASGCFGDPKC